MSEEDRKWLEQLIEENKESDSELLYTYCPFSVLYALQQENQELKRNCNIGYEELNFYRGEYKKIKPVLDQIKEYINKNECNYIYLDCKLYETEIYKHLLQILDKVGKE